ncbi:hypothetical protein Celal_3652 [Cellulophaga algicola DSM 14237]|uniref:Uncharacterized protein n=1 Tax=Cellulophaga algicola (strain DSM 14237 / IC166 / ACAM 630) TaxID=688270 RepID=E6X997_CELAD|nr:hypothetical protein Celal_3652 [Cellulophaga algicola DSM 14237]
MLTSEISIHSVKEKYMKLYRVNYEFKLFSIKVILKKNQLSCNTQLIFFQYNLFKRDIIIDLTAYL